MSSVLIINLLSLSNLYYEESYVSIFVLFSYCISTINLIIGFTFINIVFTTHSITI